MSFYGKVYTYLGHENFDSWLKTVGVPDDKVQDLASEKSTMKVVQNGDTYTITKATAKGEKETTFKHGVELDDTIGHDKAPIKSTYTVDGNTITQIIKSPHGIATLRREYNGDELIMHVTSDKYDGVAKRYYRVLNKTDLSI